MKRLTQGKMHDIEMSHCMHPIIRVNLCAQNSSSVPKFALAKMNLHQWWWQLITIIAVYEELLLVVQHKPFLWLLP